MNLQAAKRNAKRISTRGDGFVYALWVESHTYDFATEHDMETFYLGTPQNHIEAVYSQGYRVDTV